MRLCRSQPFRDTEFYTHDYLLLSPYIFYMPPYKLFSTARSYSLSMIKFFYTTGYFTDTISHTHLQFYVQKSTPTHIFLRFTFIHIQVVFYFLKLEQIQRRATRWILKVKVGDFPYRDRLSILNMLPLCYDREIRDLMFFYKALHGFYDLNVEDFVSFVTHGRTRLSSNSTVVLKTPYCKTTTFQASFFNRIVKIWNSICKVATCSSFTSVTTFKTFLINHYNELLLNVFDANLTCTWSVVRDCACHRS